MIIAILSFIFLTSVFTSSVQATPQSDYEYQLTQYRKYNTEFKSLKEDNQKNPTLDNQQKALQAAKQTIISRDQTKIAYIDVILDSIRSQGLTQDHILQTEQDLVNAKAFYGSQITLVKEIVSVTDLTNFTIEYLADQLPHQTQIIRSLATKKFAELIRIQLNANNAYNILLPKIPNKTQTPVSAGLTKITKLAESINNNILSSVYTIKTSEITVSNSKNFYKKQTENLIQVRDIQLELVNTLIDLEKNYAN